MEALEPTPGRWTRPPAPPGGLPWPLVLLFGALAAAFFGGAAALGAWGFAVPGSVTAVLAALAWKRGRNPMLGVDAADLMLLEDPSDRDVCLVRLTVLRDGRVVGRDKGVAWFEDGRLLYNGHRTSFALGGEDVQAPRTGEELGERTLPLRVAQGRAAVELLPLRHSVPAEMRFLKRLYRFRQRPPRAAGPRQLPPLER